MLVDYKWNHVLGKRLYMHLRVALHVVFYWAHVVTKLLLSAQEKFGCWWKWKDEANPHCSCSFILQLIHNNLFIIMCNFLSTIGGPEISTLRHLLTANNLIWM